MCIEVTRRSTVSSSRVRGLASRGPMSAATRAASRSSATLASRSASRIAMGNATSAVTSTETTATAQVTRTARAVSVRPKRRLAIGGVAPHRGEQLLPREHPSGPAHQVSQQVELGRSERHRFVTGQHEPPYRVERDRADPAYPVALRRALRATQHGLDPGDQLARAERLGHVVVGAELQAEDPVDLVVAGGEEQYRCPIAGLAQPPADLGAVHAGQRDVQDAGDRAHLPGRGQTRGTVMLDVHPETLAGQVHPDQVGDGSLVLDDEHQTLAGRLVSHLPIMPAAGHRRVSTVFEMCTKPRSVHDSAVAVVVVTTQARRLVRAAWGTALVFAVSGATAGTWVSRLPAIRDRLHASTTELGLVLLAPGIGSLLSMPLTGRLCRRFGSRLTVAGTSVPACAAVALVGAVPTLHTLAITLFAWGLLYGAWDVAMNVQGSTVDQRSGRVWMPRYHACWSLGGVLGAVAGALAARAAVPVWVHL